MKLRILTAALLLVVISCSRGHKMNCDEQSYQALQQDIVEDSDNSIDAKNKANSLLHLAAARGDISIAKLALQHGAKISARKKGGKIAAEIAQANGHFELAEKLLPFETGALISIFFISMDGEKLSVQG